MVCYVATNMCFLVIVRRVDSAEPCCNLGVLLAAGGVFALLRFSMGEEDQAVGLRGAKVKGDGSRPLGVPLGEADEGFRGLKGNGVQSGHILTFVRNLTHDLHLRVHDPSQAGQLQANVIVLVDHL